MATGSVTSNFWHDVVIKAEKEWRGVRRPQVAMHSQLPRFLVSFQAPCIYLFSVWVRTGVIGGRAQGSISVTAVDVCQGSGTLQRDYTKTVLEYRIEVNYLAHYSLHDLTGEVTVTPCGAGTRHRRDANDNVIVTVTIRGEYESV